MVAEFDAEGIGEGNERGFRGAVDGAVGDATEAGNGGHVDDVAGALTLHMGENGLGEMKRAEKIGLEEGKSVVGLDVFDGGDEAGTGVVDENVYAAELGDGFGDGVVDVGAVGDVAGESKNFAGGETLHVGGGFSEAVRIAGDHDDGGAFGKESAGHGEAKTAAGTGIENDAVGESWG